MSEIGARHDMTRITHALYVNPESMNVIISILGTENLNIETYFIFRSIQGTKKIELKKRSGLKITKTDNRKNVNRSPPPEIMLSPLCHNVRVGDKTRKLSGDSRTLHRGQPGHEHVD